ncbi:MAG: FkbM family methyltransferase [Verrucomicrobiales bacterium]|nr:FkbM family methyltransferase [Verrucomicrobiales bacterium]
MEQLEEFRYGGHSFHFADSNQQSFAVRSIMKELPLYQLEAIQFRRGDVMIDIGAHCGLVSIVAAKMNPGISVYSFEPYPRNYQAFVRNIERNSVSNIRPFNCGVTGDGRQLNLKIKHNNTGGCSAFKHFDGSFDDEVCVESTTLDAIFESINSDSCKLLKLDCEGAEHEIIRTFNRWNDVENLVGEFHMNSTLERLRFSMEESVSKVQKGVREIVKIHFIRMIE